MWLSSKREGVCSTTTGEHGTVFGHGPVDRIAVQIETILYIPVAGNDGIAFPADAWTELNVRLAAVAEGCTRLGPHIGSWVSPEGETVVEPVFTFEVGVESWFALTEFLEVVRWAQARFDQTQIRFKIAGIAELWPS